jgi:hypothetical protein
MKAFVKSTYISISLILAVRDLETVDFNFNINGAKKMRRSSLDDPKLKLPCRGDAEGHWRYGTASTAETTDP